MILASLVYGNESAQDALEHFLLVSPRQTSIYVMCPWDHDI